MAEISVIIPVYNVAAYLPRCLDSVLAQTFRDIEILCINDYSTDGSLRVLEQYAKQDRRIKIFSNKENIGGALSRNVGLDNATGEYVYFIDSDDWIEPDYLEKMLSAIETAKTEVVLNLNILQETAQGTALYTQHNISHLADDGEFLNRWNIIANTPCLLWARLYKRSFLEEHHLRLSGVRTTCDDYIFHYISHIYTDKTFVFMGPAYHYRIHQESITGQAKKDKWWDIQFIRAYDVIYDYYQAHGFLRELPIKIFNVMSCFVIDSEEKFNIYHAYLKKVKPYLDANIQVYNELDRYVAKIVTECNSYEEYRQKHAANLTVDFLKAGRVNG